MKIRAVDQRPRGPCRRGGTQRQGTRRTRLASSLQLGAGTAPLQGATFGTGDPRIRAASCGKRNDAVPAAVHPKGLAGDKSGLGCTFSDVRVPAAEVKHHANHAQPTHRTTSGLEIWQLQARSYRPPSVPRSSITSRAYSKTSLRKRTCVGAEKPRCFAT